MKLHYKGKYDLNPESLPHGEHKPGAVKFKEAENSKQMALIGNVLAVVLMIVFAVLAVLRTRAYIADYGMPVTFGFLVSMLVLFRKKVPCTFAKLLTDLKNINGTRYQHACGWQCYNNEFLNIS